jgi:transposase InsO family protein
MCSPSCGMPARGEARCIRACTARAGERIAVVLTEHPRAPQVPLRTERRGQAASQRHASQAAASRQRYGSRRIHEDLLEQHEHVSRKRVIRLMQEEGLQARVRKRYMVTTMSDHDRPVAANVLDRQFAAPAPNQRWVSVTTELVIGGSSKLYLAAVLDLFSRFIAGRAVSTHVDPFHLLIAADVGARPPDARHQRRQA